MRGECDTGNFRPATNLLVGTPSEQPSKPASETSSMTRSRDVMRTYATLFTTSCVQWCNSRPRPAAVTAARLAIQYSTVSCSSGAPTRDLELETRSESMQRELDCMDGPSRIPAAAAAATRRELTVRTIGQTGLHRSSN